MDLSSNNSGFMSRATKNKGVRRGDGKRSVSLAIKNEALLTKIQEDFSTFKQHCTTEFVRIDKE